MAEMPEWFGDKGRKKAQNRRSARQERQRAAEIGGRASAGSGASWRAPQDVRNDEHMEQLKYTDKASFSLKLAELEQLERDARRHGLEPRFVIEFSRYGKRYIITEG